MAKPFKGTINVDIRDSEPDWTPFEPPVAPYGSPNVLYIVLDDVGFSAMNSYGGPIETPNIDRIADTGVRYTQWHTTALCSPIRSRRAPQHSPKEWADKFRGRFDMGYEAIRQQTLARQREMGIVPADTDLPPVNPLGTMESHTDPVMANGIEDDIAENLAMLDDLGTTKTYNHYPTGWATALNTPFKMWKRYEFNGGTADPCCFSWPRGIKARGEIRHQYPGVANGTLSLYYGDRKVGEGRIKTQPGKFSIGGEGLCVGRDSGEAVTDDYPGTSPWRFTGGTIDRVRVDVSGKPYVDLEHEAVAMMARE